MNDEDADDLPLEAEPEEPERAPRRHWRGWHVIGRFLPMVVLGLIFIVIGVSTEAPHHGAVSYGVLFIWIGGILIVAAMLGMMFTKCPICYSSHWIACVQEPDVVHEKRYDTFHRELSAPDEES